VTTSKLMLASTLGTALALAGSVLSIAPALADKGRGANINRPAPHVEKPHTGTTHAEKPHVGKPEAPHVEKPGSKRR
jgi:hypothetical protein